MESYEINLIDVFKKIIRRWRFLLLCALSGALLFSGIGIYNNISFNNSIVSKDNAPSEIGKNLSTKELTNLTNLTDTQISDVKTAVKAYNLIEEYYTSFEEDFEADDVYKSSTIMQYVITANTSGTVTASDLASNVIKSLEQYINSTGMAKSIEELSNGKLAFKDIKNCIIINYNQDSLTSISKETDLSRNISFFITCKGKDDNVVDLLVDYIDKVINSYVKKFANYGTVTIKLVDSYAGTIKNMDAMTNSLSDITAILTAKTTFNNITKSFVDEQKALFNSLLQKEVLVTNITIKGAIIYSDSKPVAITNGLILNIVIGMVLGIIIAGLTVACQYALSGKIKTKEDLISRFGYYCIGNAEKERIFKGFGSKFDRLLAKKEETYTCSVEDRIKLILSNIKAISKRNNINGIVISSTIALSDDNMSCINFIIEQLQNNGIEISFEGNVLTNVNGFDQMTEKRNIIIVEKIGDSKLNDIEKLDVITKEYDVNILGFICI